jgi:putative N6-adenine-specific DNA methylase
MRHQCLAVCTPGIEGVLSDELRSIGLKPQLPGRGGVSFTPTTRQLYLANRWIRTATRVLVRVGRFRATNWEQLVAGVEAIDWDGLLPHDKPVHLRVSSTGSRLFHTGAIEERIVGALRRPTSSEADDDAQLIVVRAIHDELTVSLDSSGEALHRRTWRLATAKAPLRPTLAAAMLLAIGWDGTRPLVDPFCGSGTIAIEAALLARGLPPSGARTYAFQQWPGFEPGTWASVVGSPTPGPGAPTDGPRRPYILASDRDAGAVAATIENSERAGVGDGIEVLGGSVSQLAPSPGSALGWLVSNPPHGHRIKGGADSDLRDLYARLGDVARKRLPGWGVALLVADRRVANHTGLALSEPFRTSNGGIPVQLVVHRPRAD